ncbi:MAG: S41 family peptidase [Minisyncoccota bacterium]
MEESRQIAPEITDAMINKNAEYERGHRIFKRSITVLFIVLFLGVVFFVGYEYGRKYGINVSENHEKISQNEAILLNKNSQDKTIDFALFWRVWGILKEKYVDGGTLDANTLVYGAIEGMLSATGDPYTTFFDPAENKEFQEDISGVFEGIGAEMGIKDDVLTIIAPLEGTPAEQAGLMADDKILTIDDKSTTNMSVEQAVGLIRGKKGTEVKLNIFHIGDEEPHDVLIKRDVILVKSVRFEMKENDIALIRVSRFGEDTEKAFRTAIKQALDAHAQKLILDMRNNPGGFLDTSVEMASLMLPTKQIVVMEEDGTGSRKELRSRGGDQVSHLPTVVLINEGSASASEILAGALRENRDNVTVIGKKSFGKGSVQELISLTKETSVKITVARWLTPKGNQINKVGISPDIEVTLTRDDLNNKRDPQLDKALEVLKTK